ncbi:MAG TPA: GntR family transcriptional regulator, partial [Levilinea sp.]|nr:GntR family transcriptional regulator [Levilinea sp.]
QNIPTELELMDMFGISRSTIRQAILALVNDGYLRRDKSKGTIVTSPTGRMRFVGSLISFSEEMNSKGIRHYSRILDQRVLSAKENVSRKLRLETGTPVYYLNRVRYINDEPFLIDEHFIPYSLCPGIEQKYMENTSLYQLLKVEYRFNLHHGQIEFEPISPPTKEAIDLLKVYSTTSLLYVERIVYSEKDIALDYFTAMIHGKFAIDVINA